MGEKENSDAVLTTYGTIYSSSPEKVSTIGIGNWSPTENHPSDGSDQQPNFNQVEKTLPDSNTTFGSKSLQGRAEAVRSCALNIIRNITVEPYLFLSIISLGMTTVVSQNLVLYKVCLNDFHYGDDVCKMLKDNKALENKVQAIGTNLQMYKTFIATFPTILIAFFLGSWSDRNGRKFFMLMPCMGGIMNTIIYMVNAHYMDADAYYLLIADVPVGLAGSTGAIMICTLAYVIDTSTVENRTMRITMMQSAMMCGAPIGTLLGGVLFTQFGYITVFVTGSVLNLCAFLYVMFVIKETIVPESKNFRDKVCSFFDLSNIKAGIMTCLKKRELNHRSHIICLIIAMMVNILPFMAETTITYYYVRLKFGWEVDMYSHYSTTILICNMIGLLFFIPLFIKLKLWDVTMALIGACSKVGTELILAFAETGWVAFAASPLIVFGGLNSPIVRSMLSKCVNPSEQGKIMSVVVAFESGMPIIGSAIYSQVYNATRTTFPGTIYIISAVLTLIPVSLFVWISRDLKKQQKKVPAVPNDGIIEVLH